MPSTEEVLSLTTEDEYPLWELRDALVGSEGGIPSTQQLQETVESMVDAGLLEVLVGSAFSKVNIRFESNEWRATLRAPGSWRMPTDPDADQVFVVATDKGRNLYFGLR